MSRTHLFFTDLLASASIILALVFFSASPAETTVEADSQSASARVALSYVQQANLDLRGALTSLKEAVQLDPENALAWARLSELWLSFGDVDEALKAAQKAAALNPNLSRTQAVMGFAYLRQVKTRESKETFERAIQLDQGDPLPRLGLGLAKIRDGDLANGRREVEVAASLDPNNSLIRSYLGKAYYEEKQEKLSSDQYKMAKELDPKDPTPYFYDAILKQTTNRPVEALHDLQQAIELNNNRQVYRSKQLLDEDLAARSAALARVYTDLGFPKAALVEGWKSVNTDPSDYSGHRFLADTYAALPRHEIARVSELLQSQLLQPLNMTPIQPRLAESNLFLISTSGPGSLSFNEFNPLFSRDGITFQGSGLLGENDTWGAEGVLSGIYKRASFSVGYSHFDTDGWGVNTDQKDNIANAFVQLELSPETSIQGEYRYRDNDRGDMSLHFFEENTRTFLRDEDKVTSFRLGGRHAFSPDSILIGNFQYSNAERNQSNRLFFDPADFGFGPPPVEDSTDDEGEDDAFSGELSHLYRSKVVDIVSGAGAFIIDRDINLTDTVYWPGIPPLSYGTFTSRGRLDISHYNLYFYSYIKALENLTLTLGASGDFYKADDRDLDEQDLKKNQFNPKFGVTWQPFDGTTVRGAVFRTLKRTLITDQTLEPTQVAGFNQFFDDLDGTDAWLYGVAVDQKFPQDIYTGVEFAHRDLEVPGPSSSLGLWLFDSTLGTKEADWDETLGRAYFYWTPHKWLAFKAEYGYEKFRYADEVNPGARKVETHSIPLGVNFFHPSGLFAGLQTTYYYQKGDFERSSTLTFESAHDAFWLVDAALGYRFPNRYGLLTVGVTNLFDKEFEFFEVDPQNDPKNLRIKPDRQVFGKLTVAF